MPIQVIIKLVQKPHIHPVTNIALICWSILWLLLALLSIWLGTGKDALGGPSTTTDTILNYVWLALTILQLIVAIALSVRYTLWLVRTFLVVAILSIGVLFVPWLLQV